MTITADRRATSAPPDPTPRPGKAAASGVGLWFRHRAKLWHLFLLPFCLVWIYPFIWVLSSAFKSQSEMLLGGLSVVPRQPTVDNFVRAWQTANFGAYTVNTVVFSVTVVVIIVAVSSTAGYALGRGRLPGKKIIIGVLIATMFIPHGYTIIPVFKLVDALGLNNGLIGAVLAAAGPAHVIQILLFMGYFAQLPQELEDAAKIDGAGFLRTFFQVMLPLAKPIIGTVTLFSFIGAWNAFMVPLVFTLGRTELRTLGVGMYSFFGQYTADWTGLAAAACISLVPIVTVFLLLQRTFVEGIAGAVKS